MCGGDAAVFLNNFDRLLPAALRAGQSAFYISYSTEGDFEYFRRAVARRCTDGGEIWHGLPSFISTGATMGIGPPKLKCLLRFDQNSEYKRPAGACPLRDFHEICRIYTPFHEALTVRT